jgi:hypothetical protein
MNRSTVGLVLIALLTGGQAATAQDETPAVLVWTHSLNAFFDQGKTLLTQIGQGNIASTFAEQGQAKLGVKGLTGIDRTRPLGAFLRFTPDPSGALLVPIVQERDFFDLLERFDIKSAKEADGTYRLAVALPIPVYAKVVGNYAWITILNKTGFAATLDPAKIFPQQSALVSARVQIDGIPKDARQLAISQFEDSLQQAMKKNDAGTPAQKAFTEASNLALARFFAQSLEEGRTLAADLAFDAKDKSIQFQLALAPRPGTPLAKTLADAGQRSSVFGALGQASLAARVNLALPDAVAKAFTQLVEESFTEGAAGFRDADKKKQAQNFLDAIKPSLAAGEIDTILRVLGPNPERKVGVVVGLKAQAGDRLGDVFKALAEDATKTMSDAEKAKVMLDADAVGATKIHRFILGADQGRKVMDVFGDPTLSLAFRSDAVLFGIGYDSKTALKTLAETNKPGSAPLALVEFDCKQMAPLMAPTGPDAGNVFTAPTDGMVRAVVLGGEQLRVSVSVRTPVLQFLGQVRGAKGDGK